MDNTNQHARNIHSDFGLVEFLDEANFDQFIEFIKGEHTDDSIASLCPRIDCANIPSCFEASHFVLPTHQENDATSIYGNQNFEMSILSGEIKGVGEDEYIGETSSATTTTITKMSSQTKKTNNNKADRSRTLISERRRRFRMKEKLYALRALVPNITKMDKASIIGDAVAYVQDLQVQARKLKAEISELELSSLNPTDKYNGTDYFHNKDNLNIVYNYPLIKTITQLEVFQIEERGFYVRVGCQKGKGVAVLLYKVLESFVNANVTNSNLITAAEVYILTFTLNNIKKECKVDMNVNNLKLWIATAFLNHGFDFETNVLLA